MKSDPTEEMVGDTLDYDHQRVFVKHHRPHTPPDLHGFILQHNVVPLSNSHLLSLPFSGLSQLHISTTGLVLRV